jgi:hypothetical protein
LRDSAPYLHDGRANTVRDAVALHGGEGAASAQQFLCLNLRERQQIELFLNTPEEQPTELLDGIEHKKKDNVTRREARIGR